MKPRDLHHIYILNVQDEDVCKKLINLLLQLAYSGASEQFFSVVHSTANEMVKTYGDQRIKDFLGTYVEVHTRSKRKELIDTMRGRIDESDNVRIIELVRSCRPMYLRQQLNFVCRPPLPEIEMAAIVREQNEDENYFTLQWYWSSSVCEGSSSARGRITDPFALYLCEQFGRDPDTYFEPGKDFRTYQKGVEEIGKKTKIVVSERLPAILREEQKEDSLDWAWRVLTLEPGNVAEINEMHRDILEALENHEADASDGTGVRKDDILRAIEAVNLARTRILDADRLGSRPGNSGDADEDVFSD